MTVLTCLGKLVLSYKTYGTNDVTYWMKFSDLIHWYGTFNIYKLSAIYNHPPLISWILKGVRFIHTHSHLSFPFVFRLIPIFSDMASVLVIWKLLERYQVQNKLRIGLLCAFNPINFLISGFHGNTDPVFVFLVLLSICLCERKHTGLAGLIYGLSMCIKIVPVILTPVFLFGLPGKKEKILFFSFTLFFPVLTFLPYFVNDYHVVMKNIFNYSSLQGIWGLGHMFRYFFENQEMLPDSRRFFYSLFQWHVLYGRWIFLLGTVFLLYYLRNKRLDLIEGVFLVFCLFLALTPGFGVQYLSWLSFFAPMVFWRLGIAYVLCGGIFLYRVYTYWSGGFPMYYANSDQMGQWKGFEEFLDIALWFVVVTMLIIFLKEKVLKPSIDAKA